ncbi:hypothetical protein K1719_013072 [Acacia pycnantha]|nr:hypothetical protein K1719_013072 [Acacia pycnantha]
MFYCVLTSAGTPDVPYGSTFRVEIIYLITPGEEMPSGEQCSHLVTVKPVDLKDLDSTKEQGLESVHAEPQSNWKLAAQFLVLQGDGLKQVLEGNPNVINLSVPGCTILNVECIVNILKDFKSIGTHGVKNLRIGAFMMSQESILKN